MNEYEDIDETTDGPDLLRAQKALADAKRSQRQTDKVVSESRGALNTLKELHTENHFTDKLRLIIRGVT